MREKILAYLTIVPSATAEMISSEAGIDPRECQDALHAMDDAGQVIMRQGWYRLSEAEKRGRGAETPNGSGA